MIERFGEWLEKVMGMILFDEFFWSKPETPKPNLEPPQPKEDFYYEDWQNMIAGELVKSFDNVIINSGGVDMFVVTSIPGDPYLIKVVKNSSDGIYFGCFRGFEFFRVEINSVGKSALVFFQHGQERSRFYVSREFIMEKSSNELVEKIVDFLQSIELRGATPTPRF